MIAQERTQGKRQRRGTSCSAAGPKLDRRALRDAAQLLRTMAHPTRLAILHELTAGPKCVTDIRDLLEVAQPNVSQHLSALRLAGMVDYHEDGTLRCYYLARPALARRILKLLESNDQTVFPSASAVRRAAAARRATEACTPRPAR